MSEIAQDSKGKVEDVPFTDWGKHLTWIIGVVIFIAIAWWLQDQVKDRSNARIISTTITGLLVGGVYALVALGIVVINKASGIFNFAHGYMMYFGALVFYSFFTVSEISVPAAAILAIATVFVALTTNSFKDILNPRSAGMGLVVVGLLTFGMTFGDGDLRMVRAIVGGVTAATLLGFLVERFTIRPLIGQPLFTVILMTLAIDRLLQGIAQLIWGSLDKPLSIFTGIEDLGLENPIIIDANDTFVEGVIRLRADLLVAFVLALIAFAGFVLFFRYTNVGLAMRATAENQQLAQSVGLRVRVILAIAWAIAALLALAAGVLQGGATGISKSMPGIALAAFPAVLLGGLESVGGALVGGLVIGLVQEWANFLPAFQGTEAGTQLAPYVVLMIVLIIRPDGLFGQKRIERI